MRAAGMRSRRYKQDSRIKRKFLSGVSLCCLSPSSSSCWKTRGTGGTGGRTPAASARFHDNYLHQIESWLGLHGGKQKNPPLARMLTRQQEEEEKDSKRDAASTCSTLLFLPTTVSHIPGENLGRRVEMRSWEFVLSVDGPFINNLRKDRDMHASEFISLRYPPPWTRSGIVF